MIKGKTKSGFSYVISEKRLNNYKLLEAIGEVEDNPLLVPKVLDLLLGAKQTEKLKKCLEDKDGIIPMDKMLVEIQEIFESQKPVKN